MKAGARMLSIGTGPSERAKTIMVGVVSRSGTIEGIVSTEIDVDGSNATECIARLFKKSRFSSQIKVIAMNGIGVAGLNIVDIGELRNATGCQILSITRKKPHPKELVKALMAFFRDTKTDVKHRISLVNRTKELQLFRIQGFYAQTTMSKADTSMFIAQAKEQLRLVHLIASGVSRGESKGRM